MGPPVMAKEKPKKVADDRSGRKTAPVQIDKDLAQMLATIATHEQTTQASLLTPLIRQWIITNYERVQKEMGAKLKEMKDAE
jgi:hypothetical protein